MNKLINRSLKHIDKQFSTSVRAKVLPDKNVMADIEAEAYKPRKHPGIVNISTVSVPDKILKAIENILEDQPVKALLKNSETLARHLKGRVPPMETEQLNETKYNLYNQVLRKEKSVEVQKDEDRFNQSVKDKVQRLMKEKVYNWSPINYTTQNALLYLLARSANEFAVLSKIFREISLRDIDFKPRSLFDFGSGVGTATWAANAFWKNDFFEYFNVDISPDMNDLAQSILQGGRSNNNNQQLKGIFYRQFLPSNNTLYDLVVSSYSLLELPSFETRMETVLRLWNKTNKYLVIVENGTNAGFKVVNEVREFLLKIKEEPNVAHVFSPCPHDLICPRFLADDGTPCNFEVAFHPLPLTGKSTVQREHYSYIVLKKGKIEDLTQEWPRLVRDTLVRSKHSICRMCTAQGKLSEVIFTASKHGKTMYHCARSTKWGDRLPVSLAEQNTEEETDKT